MNVPKIKLIAVKEKDLEYGIKSSEDAFDAIKKNVANVLKYSAIEVFGAIGLDQQNRLIFIETQPGSVNESRVYIPVLAKKLLLTNCTSVILFHNHPSGNPKVSDADINITNKIKSALDLFEIRILDHIIIADDNFTSFKELGYIN